MKSNFLLLAIFIGIFPVVNAQRKIEVTVETVTMSRGNHPVYMVTIPESNIDRVKKEWMKELRQNTKSKTKEAGSEMIIEGTLINSIYNKPINIYSILVGPDSVLRLYASFEIDSVFFALNESNKTIQNEKTDLSIKEFLRNFAVGQYQYSVGQQLGEEQKKLKVLNNEFEGINDQVEKFNKKIAVNEQNITNSQDEISSYQLDNERKLMEINSQKESISSITDPELKKQGKSELRSLKKEKRSIENKLEKDQKKIVEYKTEILRFKQKIEKNLKVQEDKKSEIARQEDVVKLITSKLNGIK